MKKGLIIVLLIGVVVSLVGAGILAYAVAKDSFKYNKPSQTNIMYIEDDFDNFDIELNTSDIKFVITSESKCIVECLETEKQTHTAKLENKTLVVRCNDTRKWYEKIFSFGFESMKVTINVPKDTYNNIKLKNDTGNVEISNLTFNDLNVKTSTGNIRLNNLNTKEADIEASTGNVIVDTINSTNASLKASTGNVNFNNYIVENILTANTSTGNINFSKIDAKDITMKTSTGNIEGSILTAKTFTTNSSTGHIDVPNTTGDRCKLETSTGNIKVSVINKYKI